jgi:hypothetical protein
MGSKDQYKKTKICTYEKRKSREQRQFYIDDKVIDIIDSICYLGVTFVSNGNIAKTAKILYYQALKAMYNLLSLFTRIHVDIIRKLKLKRPTVIIDRQDRLCEHYTTHVVESEYHFLLICTHYSEIRKNFFPNTAWPYLP